MVTRVADAASNENIVSLLLQTQANLKERELQVSSGKASQDYTGVAQDSERLVNLENQRDIMERFTKNNETIELRLNLVADSLDTIQGEIKDFRNYVSTYRSGVLTDQAAVETVQKHAYDALKNIEAFLNNTNVDSSFLFSGSRSTSQPVDLELGVSLDAFQAANDGNLLAVATTRDAHLAEFSISSDTININKNFIDTSKYLIFRQDDDGDTTTAGDSTIEATSAMFTGITAGTRINVTGTTSNNGVHTVESVSSDGTKITIVNEMLTDETVGSGVFTLADATTLQAAETGSVTYNRAANTITAGTANAFANVIVGEVITVAGTAQNNGTYTVTANSGTALTIESKKLVDEGLASGGNFLDYTLGTQVVFDNAAGTIKVETNAGAGPLTGIFSDFEATDQITIAGATTGANDTTYTISSVSTDGSTLTVTPLPDTTETDTNGTVLTSASPSFSYTAGTQVVFTDVGAAGTDTIQVQQIGAPNAAVPNVFADLRVGMRINASGMTTNNGAFTITAISADKSQVTVAEDITVTETDADGGSLRVFAVGGTVSASNYYSGDARTATHRVDANRSITLDINAIDPAFEKAIRAMKIIAQGVRKTEGGLDQNSARAGQAIFLLDDALDSPASGTPPFGAELASDIASLQFTTGFNQVVVDSTKEILKKFAGFLDARVSGIENIDPLEVITRLLDDSRALEASYQTLARVKQLTLLNFLR
jgi:hypothetical protein